MKKANKVRLTESQLNRVIMESVQHILNEAFEKFTPEQWANLAGQAYGSKKSGISGMLNPAYNKRKQRQAELFAQTAANGRHQGMKYVNSNNYSTDVSKEAWSPYDVNQFAPKSNMRNYGKNGEELPFNMGRQEYNTTWMSGNEKTSPRYGETMTPSQFRAEHPRSFEQGMSNDNDAYYGTNRMNRAFRRGVQAAQGKPIKNIGGKVYDKNYYFQPGQEQGF